MFCAAPDCSYPFLILIPMTTPQVKLDICSSTAATYAAGDEVCRTSLG